MPSQSARFPAQLGPMHPHTITETPPLNVSWKKFGFVASSTVLYTRKTPESFFNEHLHSSEKTTSFQ